jgi:hypothetical protein
VSAVCPNGHTSEAEDYCDTCGSPIDTSAQPAQPGQPAQAAGSGAASGTPSASAPSEPAATPAAGSSGSTSTGSSLDLDPATPGGPGVDEPDAGGAPAPLDCPNCHTENPDGALFCEACGYDFTTGAMPRDPAGASGADDATADGTGGGAGSADDGPDGGATSGPAAAAAGPSGTEAAWAQAVEPFDWLAEVWVDPDWYQTQEAEDPCPSPGLPIIMPLRHRSVLLGRVSTSRNTHPEIDLSSDPGVSRRHAQLTTDGSRWFVEDLGSSNGTFVGPASGPLPERAIAVGPKTELGDDDRLYVGAWTRVVVRRATPDEVETYA